MKNKDFEEINDLLGDIIGGTSGQSLFQFSCDSLAADTTKCSELCFTDCSGVGTKEGTTKGTITEDSPSILP